MSLKDQTAFWMLKKGAHEVYNPLKSEFIQVTEGHMEKVNIESMVRGYS